MTCLTLLCMSSSSRTVLSHQLLSSCVDQSDRTQSPVCPIWPRRVKVTLKDQDITRRQVPAGATSIVSPVHLCAAPFVVLACDMTAWGQKADRRGTE